MAVMVLRLCAHVRTSSNGTLKSGELLSCKLDLKQLFNVQLQDTGKSPSPGLR